MKEQASFYKIIQLLTPAERRRGAAVVLLIILNAVIETAGVASIFPFLAVLGNPELVQENPVLRWIFESGGFRSADDFLLFLGAASLIVVIGSAIVRTLTEYAMVRFVEMRRHSLSSRLLQRYLRQPYSFFLNRNSADLSKGILSEVDEVILSVLMPALRVPAYGLVVVGLALLLFFVDPVVATVSVGVVGGLYAATYFSISGMLRRRGQDRIAANRGRFTAASEAFGGIKEVKLLGREDAYVARFRDPSVRFSRHQAAAKTLAVIPRYSIEAIGFGGILGLTVYLMAAGQGLGRVLPVLGLYAFAGYRLLPAAQHFYSSFTKLRFGFPAVEALHNDLQTLSHTALPPRAPERRQRLNGAIRWTNVTFQYPQSEVAALRNVSLEIPAQTTVAFVGETGAGKTTAVDLILGLLHPTDGEIRIGGTLLYGDDLRRWQNSIGYVPQAIYLSDETVAANIAFGIPAEDIDQEAVERAARTACLHEFIVEQLPHGYDTLVGERGVRLSGGQRQRLGIARALYADPPVLVFDEATSALDPMTEQAVMDAVRSLGDRKTIILIAHRLSTVKDARKIFLLDGGSLEATGTFEELVTGSPRFRQISAGVGM